MNYHGAHRIVRWGDDSFRSVRASTAVLERRRIIRASKEDRPNRTQASVDMTAVVDIGFGPGCYGERFLGHMSVEMLSVQSKAVDHPLL